jgi:CRP-like cAMP-binding protein
MATTARAETLAKIPLFRTLAAPAIIRLDRQCAWKRAAAGQWLLGYQDASDDVFFVVAGAVRVIIQSGGREVLLREIKAGEFFGELAAIVLTDVDRLRRQVDEAADEG